MQIEEIELDEDYVKVYFTEVSTPLAISRDAFYRWLESNEMLHWNAEEPRLQYEFKTRESGDWSQEEYFQLDNSIIQIDIAKYLQTLDL